MIAFFSRRARRERKEKLKCVLLFLCVLCELCESKIILALLPRSRVLTCLARVVGTGLRARRACSGAVVIAFGAVGFFGVFAVRARDLWSA